MCAYRGPGGKRAIEVSAVGAWYISLTVGGLAFVLTCVAGLLHGVAMGTTLARAGLFAFTSGVAGYGLWLLAQNYFCQSGDDRLNKVGQNIDIKIDEQRAAGQDDAAPPSGVGAARQRAGRAGGQPGR